MKYSMGWIGFRASSKPHAERDTHKLKTNSETIICILYTSYITVCADKDIWWAKQTVFNVLTTNEMTTLHNCWIGIHNAMTSMHPHTY